jgi:CRP-like cAMP-binding protein
MTIDSLAAHFLRQELFQGLRPLALTEIVRRAERVVYKPGQTIISDGEEGDAAVLVVAGEAVRIKGSPERAEREAIEPGSLLGEMAMLVETAHSSTIVAETPVRALRIGRDTLQEIMADDPAVAEHFVDKVVRRLQHVADELRRIDRLLDGEAAEASATTEAGSEPDHGNGPSGGRSKSAVGQSRVDLTELVPA